MTSTPIQPELNEHEPRRGRLRWWIVWTLFFSTVTNYVSRQSLSVLAPMISRELHFSHADLARIFGAFQLAYGVTWLLGGILLDAVGTRIGLAIAALGWSLANMLTGFASSVSGFAFFRFLLGVGEGFNWPGASKTVAEWFPRQERGLAVAIFDSGSSVGGAVATLALPWIALAFGWRWAFAASGILGLIWVAVWLAVYHPIARHPRLSASEAAYINAGRDVGLHSPKTGARRWLGLLRDRNLWAIVIGRSLTDPIWWFYVFWLPQYLSDARGFSLRRIALFAWIPFLAADLGNFTGGLLSGLCIRRGMSTIRARKLVCIASCVPVLAGIPVARVGSPYTALALISIAVWGYASWSTMGLTLPSDLFPHDVVASVTGLSGLAAGLLSTAFTLQVGYWADHSSYAPAFLAAGLLPLGATAAVLVLVRPRPL